MIFQKWPDVEFIATQDDLVISEITCPVCGAKESVHNAIGRDLRLPSRLDAVQKAADHYVEQNKLWKAVQASKIDLFETLYTLRKIGRAHEKDNARGFAVPSFQGGRTDINCLKCGASVGFNYDIRTKFDSEMPSDIPVKILRTLKPPVPEVLGRMLSRKDETPIARNINGVLELIDEKRFKATETVVAKVRELCNELDSEFRGEFEEFLTEFGKWLQKRKDDDFQKYLRAVDGFAKYVCALEESNTGPTILDRIKNKLKPNQAAVMFPEDAEPERR